MNDINCKKITVYKDNKIYLFKKKPSILTHPKFNFDVEELQLVIKNNELIASFIIAEKYLDAMTGILFIQRQAFDIIINDMVYKLTRDQARFERISNSRIKITCIGRGKNGK